MPRAVEEPPLKVCYVIPIYNEPYCELSATLRSIAENIEVWRRSARCVVAGTHDAPTCTTLGVCDWVHL